MMPIRTIAANYNAEIALVILLLRNKLGKASEKDIIEFLSNHSIDENLFLQLLNVHQVESLVFSSKLFRKLPISENEKDKFKRSIEYRSKFNLVILEELLRLCVLFNDNELHVLFYKGVLLSKILFDDFSTRVTSDIDVLIKSVDFERIRLLLINAGYEEMDYFSNDYPEYFLETKRESSFRKQILTGQFIMIELQWAPLLKMFWLPYNNDYYFSNKSFLDLLGKKIPVPSTDRHLLILLVHHGLGDLWRILKHVFDIAAFTERYQSTIDWKGLETDISHWQFQRVAKVGSNLSEELFGVKVPLLSNRSTDDKQTNIVLRSLLQYPLLAKEKKVKENILRQFLLSDTFIQKLHLFKGYFLIYLKPSISDLERIKLPPFFFPLYYLTKRFRFLFK